MNDSGVESRHSVLDLEALKSRCLGNLELVERVLKSFSTQLDTDLAQLESALLAGDAAAFAQVAHRIKGMSANIEARSLFEDAVLAEQSARENSLAELPTQLARLQVDRAELADSLASLAFRRA